MRKIVSISGGGIRGIIPCCALIELERQTGKLTRDTVEFVAGTSTGALLAAAVAAGVPAVDILPIYTERAPREIFTGHGALARMIVNPHGAFKSEDIAKVLRTVIPESWTLNDSPVRLLITAMHVGRRPLYFVQDRPRNAKTTGRLSLIDCAVASAVSPPYFNSRYVSPLPAGSKGPFGNDLIGHCFDGGTGILANPVHRACIEAFRYDDFDPKNTQVISLGTGWFTPAPEVNPPSGIVAEMLWLVNSMLDASHDEQAQLVDWYYPGIMTRLNPELPRAIDEADMSAIPALVEVGKQAAAQMDWRKILEA